MTRTELLKAVLDEKRRTLGNDCAFDMKHYERQMKRCNMRDLTAILAALKLRPAKHVTYMPH